MSKKKFRLEDGTQVIGDIGIYKAYASKRNKERYLKRKQDEYVKFSLDEEQVQDFTDGENIEELVEHKQAVQKRCNVKAQTNICNIGNIIICFYIYLYK